MNSSESIKPIGYLKAHPEETQESLALIEILAQSKLSAQRVKPKAAKQAFQRVRRRASALKPIHPQ